MAKKEIQTDIEIYRLLDDAGIKYTAQGSSVKEIDDALKTASKNGKGNAGFPEFVAVVGDFVLVGEDKINLSNHCLKEDGLISQDSDAVINYAINGALWYAKHIAKNTNFKKVFAFGCSGTGKDIKISPLFVDDREYCKELEEVDTFYNFNEDHIKDYFTREVLEEDTDYEVETKKLLQYAKSLHEDLRNYGNLQNKEKPLVVSGILLALNERKFGSFNINDLTSDTTKTDGQKIFDAI